LENRGDLPMKKPNRLINEKSPYLLQHAYNPVDWYPWGPEAFEKAKREDKPIFLSIGYSSCHWCHVMEQESFENEEVAAILNEHYVPVKVDLEERPDQVRPSASRFQDVDDPIQRLYEVGLRPAHTRFLLRNQHLNDCPLLIC
jgi:hypothetical protein